MLCQGPRGKGGDMKKVIIWILNFLKRFFQKRDPTEEDLYKLDLQENDELLIEVKAPPSKPQDNIKSDLVIKSKELEEKTTFNEVDSKGVSDFNNEDKIDQESKLYRRLRNLHDELQLKKEKLLDQDTNFKKDFSDVAKKLRNLREPLIQSTREKIDRINEVSQSTLKDLYSSLHSKLENSTEEIIRSGKTEDRGNVDSHDDVASFQKKPIEEQKIERKQIGSESLEEYGHNENFIDEYRSESDWDEYLKILVDDPLWGYKNSSDRSFQLESFIKERGIPYLVHFTRFENLYDILVNGLLTRENLQKKEGSYIFNDTKRIDMIRDSISVSISFPNYRTFYRMRHNSPNSDWVILKLDPRIIYELDVAFCFTNAASNEIRHIPLYERKKLESFKGMFKEEYNGILRKDLFIPDYYTTDPQAEILVLEDIPNKYILEVCFNTEGQAYKKWLFTPIYKQLRSYYAYTQDNKLFSPRQDYHFWSNNNNTVIRNYGNSSNIYPF